MMTTTKGRLLLWYQWLLVKTLRAWCAPPPALTFAAQIYHPALSSTPRAAKVPWRAQGHAIRATLRVSLLAPLSACGRAD